jgi:hypothetical protein
MTRRHSSIVGGSTADRLLSCPGSWQATLALPPSVEVPSEYAEEGTAMHEVMAYLMRERASFIDRPSLPIVEQGLLRLRGQTFYDRELTQAHIDTMIMPALEALYTLEDQYRGAFDVIGVEERCAFPGIPGAFGTIDLVLSNDSRVLHVDWKFGQGVPVAVSYKDDLGVKLNPQMMFYAVAYRALLPKLYPKNKQSVIAIIQPRSTEALSHTEVSAKELKWFKEDMQNAVLAALDRDPVRSRGEHCRFAPCKVNCPLWTGPLLDLSSLHGDGVQSRLDVVSNQPTPYGEYLAKAKALVDQMELFKKTLDEQLHAYLEDGGLVPGWRLKQKVKQRQWIDDTTVNKELTELGFAPAEIWQQKLQTFASTDATAKRRGVKIPDHLRVQPETTETTVCPTDDPAPPVNRPLIIEQFRESLKQLQQKAS